MMNMSNMMNGMFGKVASGMCRISMDGDIADIDKLIELKNKYNVPIVDINNKKIIAPFNYEITNEVLWLCAGTSTALLDSMKNSGNEILASWSDKVNRYQTALYNDLNSDAEPVYDVPGRFA